MYECETCGTETAETLEAFYHIKGEIAGVSLGEYKSRVNVCIDCLVQVRDFRPHAQMTGHEWRLIPV